MKKYIILSAGLCLAMSFTGCKSNESAYKRAYEKAQAQAAQQTEAPAQQVTETPVAGRQEKVSMVNGASLRDYSVVVGSFSVIANAEGLQQRLRNAGYNAQIVKNEDRNMYRVVASTFDSKYDAVQSRDQLRATYPDAWLLYYAR